ncbi:hypothetical protein [Zavarzinella formosa]|uniref:hypothetical protein n=1 Tax=Zavarzinella formosa TaxID=360055 RepID=UPI00035D6DDB|nr:hypothetical protein [Zavarzinella formosa]
MTTTEGPLGFPMSDKAARALDGIMKGLSKDCVYRKAATIAEDVQLIPGERADISLVSVESLDRQNEVVIAKGIQLDFFRENPVVTLAHKYDELPVGKCKWIKQVQKGLLAKTQYAQRPSDWEGPWLPDAIFSMTQEGILRGKSIGFLPTKMRGPTKEEISLQPTWKDCNCVIEQCVLFEYSVAPVPCNQDALVTAVSKGFSLDPGIAEKLGLKWPEVKQLPKAAPKRTSFDTDAFIKALDEINFDENVIAQQIMTRIKSRGKV